MFAPKLKEAPARAGTRLRPARDPGATQDRAAHASIPALQEQAPRFDWNFAGIDIFAQRDRESEASRLPARRLAPPLASRVLADPGQPLDPATRDEMEQRFNRDLGHVRIHADARAAESAAAVRARAFTVGDHLAFARNEFAPQTGEGRKLLAHELTHSIQQSHPGTSAPPAHSPIAVEPPNTFLEKNAEESSERPRIAPGSIARTQGIALQRQPAPGNDPHPEIQSAFTVFVAPERRRRDKQYALNEAREDAARIEKAGTLSTDDRHLINAKLRFFEGEAWEAYGKEIKPVLQKVTQSDQRKKEYDDMAAYYASERESALDMRKQRLDMFRSTVGSMTPEQIYMNWKEGGEAFASVAESPKNTLTADQFFQIYIRYWGDKYDQGSADVIRIARRLADKDFGDYFEKITHYAGGELDALGPDFRKAMNDRETGEALVRQSVSVMEYLRAAQDMGKHVTLKEVSQWALTKDTIDAAIREGGQYLGAIASPGSYIELNSGAMMGEEKALVGAMAEEAEADIAASKGAAGQPQQAAPTRAPDEAPPLSRPVSGFGRKPQPRPTAPKEPPAPTHPDAAPPLSRPVAGFGRKPQPRPTAPKEPPAPTHPDAPPPLSRPVAGFGRKPQPRPTAPKEPPAPAVHTQMSPAKVTPSSSGGKQPAGGKSATWERQGTPARASGGDKTAKGGEPHIGTVKPAGGTGGGGAAKIAAEDLARVKQLDEWIKKGVVKRGEVAKLRENLQSSDEAMVEQARAEFDANKEAIESGESHGWERHGDLPRNERISSGDKAELENSAWLKRRLPNAEDRQEFMAWLKRGHKEADVGKEIPAGKKVPKSHDHYPPGAPQTEAKVREWEQSRGARKRRQ